MPLSSKSGCFPIALCVAMLVPALVCAEAQQTISSTPHELTAADQHRIDDILGGMTLDEKIDYIGGTGLAVRAVPSVGLPEFRMADATFGVRSNSGFPSTVYCAGIGLAATWDRDLARRVGAGVGRDSRARGIYFLLGPGVNIYRSPRNGRNFEYLGEDPYLASAMAMPYILGLQQQGVSATVKHFLLNNSEFLRHASNAVVDPQALHEIYLPAFKSAVQEAHVGAVMDSYNLIDGVHATANNLLNNQILRKEWGFQGTLMSDWDATYDAVGSANSGPDIEMPSAKFMNPAHLLPALKAGTITEATIDGKVRHILTTAMEFGWLDRPQLDPSISFSDAANNQVALESARESAVLLKNSGNLLPLDRVTIKSILVVGPDAYPGVAVGGGSAGVVPFHLVSPLEGMMTATRGTGTQVFYDRGLPLLADLARSTTYTTPEGAPGLKLESFDSTTSLSGTPVVSTVPHLIEAGTTVVTLVDNPEVMAARLAGSSPRKVGSRRWTGNYTATAAGEYVVVIEGSGESSGNRVLLDGKLVLDNWDLVRAFQPFTVLALAAGPHTLVVEDKQGGRGVFGGQIKFAISPVADLVSERAKQLAAKADVVLVNAGFDHVTESESGDRTFNLPFGQDQLIQRMAALNSKTVVAVTSGGNVDSNAWLDRVPALLETWYAGQAEGIALAEIIFGETNPSGHLPVTFEKHAEDNPTFNNYYPKPGETRVDYKEGINVGYRGYRHNGVKPLFPFGYGLSYTNFEFSNLEVTSVGPGPRPEVTVSFSVKNVGKRKGADIAQIYIAASVVDNHPSEVQLKGFERVELTPGESRKLSVVLPNDAFSRYESSSNTWKVHAGIYSILVGDSVESTPLVKKLKVNSSE